MKAIIHSLRKNRYKTITVEIEFSEMSVVKEYVICPINSSPGIIELNSDKEYLRVEESGNGLFCEEAPNIDAYIKDSFKGTPFHFSPSDWIQINHYLSLTKGVFYM